MMYDRYPLDAARLRLAFDKMLNGWAFWFLTGIAIGALLFWR